MWKQSDNDEWTYWQDNKQITGWVQDNNKWFMCGQNDIYVGWYSEIKDNNGYWFYLYPEHGYDFYNNEVEVGQMAMGWLYYKDNWYYLADFHDDTHVRGQMLCNETRNINGNDYTFDGTGKLINNTGLSKNGAKFIESWEGFSSTWEDVGDHYLTIGIGTATSGNLGKQLYNSGIRSCTHEQAYDWLIQECDGCYKAIKSKLDSNGITLSQNQIDALISMAYNIGEQGLLNSTLFKNICNGINDKDTLYSNFTAWSKCNGKTWKGLLNRRISEYNLFMYADYTGNI